MPPLTQKKIFVFWAPLALTWLMIGVESPFLAAIVARLANPEPNLAAHGIAFSIAILVEAPIIMIMSASTVLARDRIALARLRNFTYFLCAALTSTINLTIHPMTSFFLGRSRMPLESLAVMPVIGALVFLFRAIGISFLEAAIALMGDTFEHYKAIRRFAVTLAIAAGAALGLVAFTPLSGLWYEQVSGLSKELATFAALPTMILVLIPAASVYFSYQRAVLVKARRTPPITWSTTLQVVSVIVVLFIAVEIFDAIGAVAAAGAIMLGSVVGNSLLLAPVTRAIRRPGP